MDDFFDNPNRLRLYLSQQGTHSSANETRTAEFPKTRRVNGEFVKGPLPLNWLSSACKLRGKSPLMSEHHLAAVATVEADGDSHDDRVAVACNGQAWVILLLAVLDLRRVRHFLAPIGSNSSTTCSMPLARKRTSTSFFDTVIVSTSNSKTRRCSS